MWTASHVMRCGVASAFGHAARHFSPLISARYSGAIVAVAPAVRLTALSIGSIRGISGAAAAAAATSPTVADDDITVRPKRGRKASTARKAADTQDSSRGDAASSPIARNAQDDASRPEEVTLTDKDAAQVERVAKLISQSGICSRRAAEKLIAEGRVTVDGVVHRELGERVPTTARICIDGQPIPPVESELIVLLHHKERGVLCTERDPQGRPTVFDRLRRDGFPRLLSVGRLDYNTEGLLLLTNSGALKRFLESPATALVRRYRARVRGHFHSGALADLQHGAVVDGVRYAPATVVLEPRHGSAQWLRIDLTEGRNREVRRLLEWSGVQVARLIRVQFGPFLLRDLPPGATARAPVKALLREFMRRQRTGQWDGPVPSAMRTIPEREEKFLRPRDREPAEQPAGEEDEHAMTAEADDAESAAAPVEVGGVGASRVSRRRNAAAAEEASPPARARRSRGRPSAGGQRTGPMPTAVIPDDQPGIPLQ